MVTHGVAYVPPKRLGHVVQGVGGIPQWSKVALCHRIGHRGRILSQQINVLKHER